MVKQLSRISFRIKMPSVAFTQFMKKVVFDKEKFSLFIENPKGVLETAGVKLGDSVTADMLMRFKFTMIRARNFVTKEKVGLDRFEDVFGISKTIPEFGIDPDLDIDTEVRRNVDIAAEWRQDASFSGVVEYSERSSETHRGANTSWENQDALTNSKSDHWTTRNFEGEHVFRPEDRFYQAPLLDAVTLSSLMTQFDIRLKEYGKY